MRFIVTHPTETRPSLVVDTCRKIDGEAEEALRKELWSLGCPTGLLFDEQNCLILRDSFASEWPQSITVVARATTDEVLSRIAKLDADFLEDRVERWLSVLSSQWASALPTGKIGEQFIADVVPATSGSQIDAFDARKRR